MLAHHAVSAPVRYSQIYEVSASALTSERAPLARITQISSTPPGNAIYFSIDALCAYKLDPGRHGMDDAQRARERSTNASRSHDVVLQKQSKLVGAVDSKATTSENLSKIIPRRYGLGHARRFGKTLTNRFPRVFTVHAVHVQFTSSSRHSSRSSSRASFSLLTYAQVQ